MKKKYFILIFILIFVLFFILFTFRNKDSTQLKFSYENYKYEELPLFIYNNDSNKAKTISSDDIKQVFYTKNEPSEYYSYLIVDNIKYDIGYVGFINLEKSDYVLTKTQIIKDNNSIYIYYINEGVNYIKSIYFQVINNRPIILTEIDNGFEFENDGEVMTYNSNGVISTSFIYKWEDDGIAVCDLNILFGAEHVQFEPESKIISVIKKVDFQNPQNNRTIKYRLKGTSISNY
ncbi:hypothetical protein JYG23_01040 [Sedimentibacter sp. zth1]|uniref:hypothetical protein n=1 Tax=Sedimentibacter sp. zth1 TaxID=2816908 RepID=UPI001A9299C0|nr:hypothetical protein [Sedimentibacter sp. zth1]QSX06082.1 hypothetical protein JYG23_01040 [Sedimentibacter sp. zth1]